MLTFARPKPIHVRLQGALMAESLLCRIGLQLDLTAVRVRALLDTGADRTLMS